MTHPDQDTNTMTNSSDLAKTAMERSQLYGLLATIFGGEPDKVLLVRLRAEDFRSLLAQSGLSFGEEFATKPIDVLQAELCEEYTQLFLGPGGHISPHESVQLKRGSGSLWGPETVLVKRFIETAGFDYDTEFNGIPDHVSVELEFLSKLTANEADCWQRGDVAAACNVLDWQLDFISRHAGKWMPGFCRKVAEVSGVAFYTVFVDLLRQFLTGEKAEIVKRLQHKTKLSVP